MDAALRGAKGADHDVAAFDADAQIEGRGLAAGHFGQLGHAFAPDFFSCAHGFVCVVWAGAGAVPYSHDGVTHHVFDHAAVLADDAVYGGVEDVQHSGCFFGAAPFAIG